MLARWHRQARRRHLAAHRHRRARPEDPAHRRPPTASTPQAVGRPARRRGVEAAARDDRHRQRRLHPHDRRAPRARRAEVPAEALRRRPHLHGRVRGLLLRRLRGVQAADRPRRRAPASTRASWSARSTRSPVELLHEKNYFFRMRAFADQLLDLYEEQPDFVQPEIARNEVVSFVKQGLADLSISRSTFDWGIKVPWDETPRRLRLVRRAAQLHHRGRLRRRTTRSSRAAGPRSTSSARTSCASTPSSGRRCCWPPGSTVPQRRLRPRLAARRRREDVEVEAHRHRAARRSPTRSAPTRSATTSCARSRSARTARSRWEDLSRALPGRARQRLRQPRLARDRDGHALLRRRRAGGRRAARPPTSRSRRSSAGDGCRGAAIDRLAIHEAIARDLGARRRAQRLHHRSRSRGRSPRTRRTRDRLDDGARHGVPTASARSPCCSRPVLPEGDREALDRARRGAGHRRTTSASTAATGSATGGTHGRAARGAVPAHRGRPSGRARGAARPTRPAHPRADGGRAVEYPPLPEPLVGGRVRQPHPPRDRRRRRAARLPRAPRPRVERRRARRRAGRHRPRDLALVGRGRRARAARARRRRASTRTRRPSSRPPGTSTTRSPRSTSSPPARACARSARPGSTSTAPATTGATRSSARSRRTSTSRSGTASPCRSTTATPTTRSSRRCAGSARPSARCSTASRGDAELAQLAADDGWYLSFAGTVTFKNAANLREALG